MSDCLPKAPQRCGCGHLDRHHAKVAQYAAGMTYTVRPCARCADGACADFVLAKPKARTKGASPTARTLAHCRRLGLLADVVERRVGRFTLNDLFGFADVLAVNDRAPYVLLVQACSATDVARRQRKLEGKRDEVAEREGRPESKEEAQRRSETARNVLTCLRAGLRVEVWGWRKLKVKRGGKAVRWEVLRRRARLCSNVHELRVEWEEVEA